MEKQKYYRVHRGYEPVEDLLEPERWESRVWVGQAYRRCADCVGSGVVYEDSETSSTCTACRGRGEVEDVRRGVSCCRSLDELRNYFAGRDATIDYDVVVELEATLSEDDDWDEEDGAVLVYPTRIVRVRPADEVI